MFGSIYCHYGVILLKIKVLYHVHVLIDSGALM